MNKFKYIIYICLGILLYLLINSLEGFTISAKIWLREKGTEHYVDAEDLNLPPVPAPNGQDHETTLLETVNHYLETDHDFADHFELAPVDCVTQSSSPHMDEPTDVTLDAEKLMTQDIRIQNKKIYCQLTNTFLNKFDSIFDSIIDRILDDNGNVVTLTLSDKKKISDGLSSLIIQVFIEVTGQRIFGNIITIRSLLNHNLDACAAIAGCFDIDYIALNPNILIDIIQVCIIGFVHYGIEYWHNLDELLLFIEENIVHFIYFSIIYKDYLSNMFNSVKLSESEYKSIFFIFMAYILKRYSIPKINKDNYKQELKKLYVMFWCFELYPSIRNAIVNELFGWGGQITSEEVPDWDIFQGIERVGRLTLYNDYTSLFNFLSNLRFFMNWYNKFCDTSDT